MNSRTASWPAVLLAAAVTLLCAAPAFADDGVPPHASLNGYSGLWAMPDARVMPDWEVRAGFSDDGPYRSYHGAAGLFDRIEVHGRLTEVEGIEPFPGEGFGDFKDRSAGIKTVIVPEGRIAPQVAAGVVDVTGTAIFGSRYMAVSKKFGDFDLTVGLGQGAMAGQDVSGIRAGGESSQDAGQNFLTSSPIRRTRPFAGATWRVEPRLWLVAEYSSLDYEALYGFTGAQDLPVNVGLKFAPWENLRLSAALMRGRDLAFGADIAFPLEPEALLTWRDDPPEPAGEKARWRAYEADDAELSEMIAGSLRDAGYARAKVSIGGSALKARARNSRRLSDADAFKEMGAVISDLAPDRIKTFFLVIGRGNGAPLSLKLNRAVLDDYLENRIDQETFMAFSDLDFYGDEHREEFEQIAPEPSEFKTRHHPLTYDVSPMLQTFLENRSGFFKHKAGIRQTATYEAWENALATFELETVLYNGYDDLVFSELEPEPARTDLTRYESGRGSRLTTMALEQTFFLPLETVGRLSWGALETAYTGAGGELFRFFGEGRFGAGIEGSMVRKRDPDGNIGLDPDSRRIFTTAFVNLYAMILPEEGIAAGLKIGRFLAGDHGVRIDLSRTFKHFTLGAWYTVTDTGHMSSSKNVGHRDKGVYIRVPFSIFRSADSPGRFRYSLSSFTRDPGQTVKTPNPLYPMESGDAPGTAPGLSRTRAD